MKPEDFRHWPHRIRVTLASIAIYVIYPVVVIASAVFVGYLVDIGSCGISPELDRANFWCAAPARLFLFCLFVLVIGVPGLAFIRFMQNFANDREKAVKSGEQIPERHEPASRPQALSFNQEVISCVLPVGSRTSHVINAGGCQLWSFFPMGVGRLTEGDRVYVVYQNVPGMTRKIGLAFCRESSSDVRGIAAKTQASSVLLLFWGMLWFAWLSPARSLVCAGLCAAWLVVDGAYLTLVLLGRRNLKEFLSGGSHAIGRKQRE